MKISLSAFLLIFLFCSCKKEKASMPPTYDFSFYTEGLSYVQLPLNKYFIYKDSATGMIDSVVVKQSNIEKKFEPSSTTALGSVIPAYYYQSFSLLLIKYGTTQEDWFYGQSVDPPAFSFSGPLFDSLLLHLVERDRATNGDLGQAFSMNVEAPAADSIFATLTIEDRTYTNVFLIRDWNGLDSSNVLYRRSYYYWVKNLGIIKREIKTFGSTKTEFLIRNG